MMRPLMLALPACAAFLVSGCASPQPVAAPEPDPSTLESVALTPGLYDIDLVSVGVGPTSTIVPNDSCIGRQAAGVWAEKILGEDFQRTVACTGTGSDSTGRRVTGKLACPIADEAGTTEMAYTGTNDADSFTVTAQVEVKPLSSRSDRAMSYPITYKGKRIGDC